MSKRNFFSLLTFSGSLVVLFLMFFFRYYVVWEDLPKNSKLYFTSLCLGTSVTLLVSSGILRYLSVVKRKKQIEKQKMQKELMSWQDEFYPDRSC